MCVPVAGGGGAGGKTSLILSYKENAYVELICQPTIENNYSANVTRKGKKFNLAITDTSGCEAYSGMWSSYFESTDVVVILFSLRDSSSLSGVLEHVDNESTKPIVLVGTKLDLKKERAISYHQGLAKAMEIGAFKYLECSSKSMKGVTEVFNAVVDAYFHFQSKSLSIN